jgi:NAD(P)-dependent dehydrogenase (short-subunit alcohol dehydrogenase family)
VSPTPVRITAVDTNDIRFPTSRELDGSDAMNPDPDYSAAYVVLRTDADSATKGAVYSLTLAMAADHVREGIRVNCVNPGTVDTPWVGRLLDAAPDPTAERAALEARQPTGRLVTAAEVAGAIAYLAGPLSGSTTGTALAVDGGMQGLRLRPVGR